MRLYRTKYKDRNGKEKTCDEWHLTFYDRIRKRRRLKAYTNKDESVRLGLEIETIMNNNGRLKTDADKKWFADLMPRIQSKLIKWGIVDGRNTINHFTTSLSEHLEVFIESRRARACKEVYIRQRESSILRTLNCCGFKMFADFDAPAIENFLARGRGSNGYGEGTYNSHLRAIKTFTKWLSDERRLTPDPLTRTKLIKQVEKRKRRRVLKADEKDRLLIATMNGKKRGNMTGLARYLVYHIALEAGLRYSEIRALKVLSFDFDANPCTVHIEAADSKGKETYDLILNDETAAEIKTFLADREPAGLAFKLPNNRHSAQMFRTDLAAAGIEYTDPAGRDCDFHSLRHTFITNLFLDGVPATVVQGLARHKDLKTTMLYSHITLADKNTAIQGLRKSNDLTKVGPNAVRQYPLVDTSGLKKVDSQVKNAISA